MSEALSTSNTAELGLWSQVRTALINAENGFEYVKGLSVLRLPGILIAVYLQHLSSCHNRVTTQSEEDRAGAKPATTVSTATTLHHLFFNYRNTISQKWTTTERLWKQRLRAMHSGNTMKHAGLRRNIEVLAEGKCRALSASRNRGGRLYEDEGGNRLTFKLAGRFDE